MKFRHSIVTRFALFFTGLIVFAIILTGYLVFRKASAVITEYSKERIMHTSELAEQSFYALLNEVSNDIAVISSSPTLQNYVLSASEKNTEDLEQFFKVTLENKASYFQIRLIGTENKGKEIIRFDKLNEKVSKSDNLQEKGDREYFKETIKIKKGELYFSEINLNEEYGIISKPYIPTLRAASPVFNKDSSLIGAVVINVNLNKFYSNLSQISGSESQIYLIDKNGQYLYSKNKSQQFGLQVNKDHNFFKNFNINETLLNSTKEGFIGLKTANESTYLSYIKPLSYFQGKQKIHLVSNIEENVLLKSARSVRASSIKILILVCLISVLFTWFVVDFFSKRINQITKAISNYNKGVSNDVDLPINRKDEIGTLARTFTKMKTTINQQVHDLNKALKDEKLAKKQKDEFLQNMSHEMRTPLNTILGLTQLLYKNSPPKTQLPIINSLERSANNLAGLVYDVLDHQKLSEGKVSIIYQPHNINTLLKDIYATYQYDAIQKGLLFSINIENYLQENVFLTDSLRFSQIVTNLVVNAIKYTQNGRIVLSARSTKIDGSLKLEIIIKDTGIGILPENLHKINDRFFREKDDISGRYGGYGLGLSIVKQLVILFKGTLKATSTKNKGSEFIVTLPLLPTNKQIDTITKLKDHPLPILSKRYTILHIEDDSLTLELVNYLIDFANIDLKQVRHIEEALEYIKSNNPDLIISDLMIGSNNLTSDFKEIHQYKKESCPLFVVSAMEPAVMKKISGIYLQKPFKANIFKDFIYKLLGKNEYENVDFSSVYKNYDHNSEKIFKVINILHDEFETYLKRIETAYKSKDQVEWEAILHKLIAHLNNLNLKLLSNLLPKEVKKLNSQDFNKIKQVILYYLCCFRVENKLNSKD